MMPAIKQEVPVLRRVEDVDGWRWYSHGDILRAEDMYAGVTGILDIAVPASLKKYFVDNSKNKQEKRLTETGNIGSDIHTCVEIDLSGGKPDLTELTKPAFDQWLILKDKHKIKAFSTETMVYSPKYGFAGTYDIYGEFEGKPCVMDIKTGFFSVKAGWQMAAYRHAAIELGLIPKDAGMVGIQVHRDGRIGQPFIFQHLDWCLKSFVSCFEVWKALYFTKLNKIEWPWLKVSSLDALKE